jgi:hypothetical protein
MLEREFYRSARGPTPAHDDVWRLVFDRNASRLVVRHEWQATGHAGVDDHTVGYAGGVDDYAVDEFLAQRGAAADALLALLFDGTTVDV